MSVLTQEGSHSRPSREEFPALESAQTAGRDAAAPRPTHRRDAVVVALAVVIAAALSARFELAEHIGLWTRAGEHYQLDEWPGVLLVLAIGLAWYALRRFRDATRELRERVRTEQQLSRALAENRSLAQQYVLLQESERKRLARELHDELGQTLNAIKLDAVAIRDMTRTQAQGADAVRHEVQHKAQHEAALAIVDGIDHVYSTVGAMIRRLRPVGLDDLGLAAAVEQCVEHWRTRVPGTRFALKLDADLSALGEVLDLTVYRLVQEALTNIARHARATNAELAIERRCDAKRGEMLHLTVADDGVGAALDSSAHGFGLVGMRERVQALNGTFGIETAPGAGFALHVELPVRAGARGGSA